MSLSDKEWNARKKFEGKMVRPQFSKGGYSQCVRVKAHGQPSGWYTVYEIIMKRGSFMTERLGGVEVKPDTNTRSGAKRRWKTRRAAAAEGGR